MVEILTFEPDLCSSAVIGKSIRVLKIRWTVHVWIVRAKLLPERRIIYSGNESLFKLHKTVEK